MMKMASRPLNSTQDRAYAAIDPMITTSTVAGTVISTVFHSDCVMPALWMMLT
jgi:hypothetical protein